MSRMACAARWLLPALVLTGPALAPAVQADPPAVTIKAVKYKDLGRMVREQKGKVVVVDFWTTNCVPCKKAFPHLVKLYNETNTAGLVVFSVALDEPTPKAQQKALEFLQEQKSPFTNLILDEESDVWQKGLATDSVPCVFLFNRDNRIEKKYLSMEPADQEDLDRRVKELLKK